ncbi:Pentatricopeptide repeat-containing protein [Drosera capensis]
MATTMKQHRTHSPSPPHRRRRTTTPSPPPSQPLPLPFPSHTTTPNLPPKLQLLCQIISATPSSLVESHLDVTGLRVTSHDVEQILKLSYNSPAAAVKFFRWAGRDKDHSPYSWNLVIDLLGKNNLFDAMWDAMGSLMRNGMVTLATFASVFGSYARAGRVEEAVGTFDGMERYGIQRDVVALNSLLSAICREGGKTTRAEEYLRVCRVGVRPDGDTYAILLEGWESEGNVDCARGTFEDMVKEIGWDPCNVPAYDSYLCTLLKGKNGIHEALKSLSAMSERRCTPGFKFFKVALEECARRDDARGAALLWEAMTVRNAFRPDSQMYNMMISLHCNLENPDIARRFLDEMVYDGVFPDARCYSVILRSFIKTKRTREAAAMFSEMVKNEFVPSQDNCAAAVKFFLASGEPYVAIKVWKYMTEHFDSDLEDTANALVLELRDKNMLPEAVKYAEDVIERRIKLHSSTLSKLKQSLTKARKEPVYDELLRKWKAH